MAGLVRTLPLHEATEVCRSRDMNGQGRVEVGPWVENVQPPPAVRPAGVALSRPYVERSGGHNGSLSTRLRDARHAEDVVFLAGPPSLPRRARHCRSINRLDGRHRARVCSACFAQVVECEVLPHRRDSPALLFVKVTRLNLMSQCRTSGSPSHGFFPLPLSYRVPQRRKDSQPFSC